MKHPILYAALLTKCQSSDAASRLRALDDLYKQYPRRPSGRFLWERYEATTLEEERTTLLGMMRGNPSQIPFRALLSRFQSSKTTSRERLDLASTLMLAATAKPIQVLPLLLAILLNSEDDLEKRLFLAESLTLAGKLVPFEALLTLLEQDPNIGIRIEAMLAMRAYPEQIPTELILSLTMHDDEYIRVAALQTLTALGERAPLEPLLAGLTDPAYNVRYVASRGCLTLAEILRDRIPLEPLLQACSSTDRNVRENTFDVLSFTPERVSLEVLIAGLTDHEYLVRCAALNTLKKVAPERVDQETFDLLQQMSGTDMAPQVRQQATHTLLTLKGFNPPPLKMLVFDPTQAELERGESSW